MPSSFSGPVRVSGISAAQAILREKGVLVTETKKAALGAGLAGSDDED